MHRAVVLEHAASQTRVQQLGNILQSHDQGIGEFWQSEEASASHFGSLQLRMGRNTYLVAVWETGIVRFSKILYVEAFFFRGVTLTFLPA